MAITQREKDYLINLMRNDYDAVNASIARLQNQVDNFDSAAYNANFLDAENNMTAAQYLNRLNNDLTNLQTKKDRFQRIRDWIVAAPLT